jgi:two-component system OmpR family response regulator
MRVLVVEDDIRVAGPVGETLRGAGYVVEMADEGEEAQFLGETEDYDAVVLDLGLPGVDGLTVLQRWRAAGRSMPVLVLTARDTWRDKVTGLRAGADDYLAKPFELEEMVARVEALIRRAAGHACPHLACGDIQLDAATGRVTRAGQPVALTALEYRTLSYLMHHAARIVSKTELTEHIYGQDFDKDSNVIEVLVNRLRQKCGRDTIETHRGRGYRMAESDDEAD